MLSLSAVLQLTFIPHSRPRHHRTARPSRDNQRSRSCSPSIFGLAAHIAAGDNPLAVRARGRSVAVYGEGRRAHCHIDSLTRPPPSAPAGSRTTVIAIGEPDVLVGSR